MILERSLIITEFIHRAQAKLEYVLSAISPNFSSTLYFDNGFLEQYGITPSLDFVEKKLDICLESRGMKHGGKGTILDLTPDDLIIFSLEKKETQERKGIEFDSDSKGPCFGVYNRLVYNIHLKNELPEGLRGKLKQSPSYDLRFELSSQEYEELRALPKNTVMRVKKLEILNE